MSEQRAKPIADKLRRAYREGGPVRILSMGARRAIHPLASWRQRTAPSWCNPLIVARCRLAGRRVVHVAGDSHALIFSCKYPFRMTWLGAATAHNLGKADSSTGSKQKLAVALKHVREGEPVILVLGEIDTRIHIFNQYEKRDRAHTLDELIGNTIDRYGAAVLELAQAGYRIVLHSVPAAPYQENIYGVDHYADDETRSWIVREYNRQLSRWCAVNGVEYLDMYSVVSDEQGFIRRELTTDGTHLNEAALPLYLEWVRANVDSRRGDA